MRLVRGDVDGRSNQSLGFFQPSGVEAERPQEVHGIRLLWGGRQHGAVKPLGLLKSACMVMVQAGLKLLDDLLGGH
jgi:hypothetical protein